MPPPLLPHLTKKGNGKRAMENLSNNDKLPKLPTMINYPQLGVIVILKPEPRRPQKSSSPGSSPGTSKSPKRSRSSPRSKSARRSNL